MATSSLPQDPANATDSGDETVSTTEALRIIVVRPDRLGDVILSTPVFDVIKRHYPKCHLTVMVREPVAPVVRGLPSVDEVLIYEPEGRHAGLRGFRRLASDFEKGGFRIAVVLQSPWKIAAAIFLAGVRYRVGPLSKLHSFFFYNRGIRQHRSQVEMHETDYNLHLLRRLGIRVSTRTVPVAASVPETVRAEARGWLMSQGWNPEEPLIAIHPGMGGSALNWPEHHYVDLMRALLKEGKRVLVTAGPSETALIDRVRKELEASGSAPFKQAPIYYAGTGQVDWLGALFSVADVVVAPSTGPLHLAVALGKPVVTFYAPIRVQSAIRWGPYLTDERRASVLVPDVYCGQEFTCRGSLCNYFPCMKTLTVTETLEHVNRQLQMEKN